MRVKLANLGKYGIVRDIFEQDIAPEAFTDGNNIRFTKKGVASFLGDKRAMATGLVEAKWLIQCPPSDRPTWVYGDESKICAYDGSVHADITRTAQGYSGSQVQRPHGILFSGLLIANNTIDVPQVWTDFNLTTNLIDMPNWPDTLRCNFLRRFKTFLIAGGLREGAQDYPFRLRWSHPAQPGGVPPSWVTNNPAFDSRQVDLGETEHALIDSLPMGEVNIIYRENSAWGMQFIGGPSKFRLWSLLDDNGLLWRDCAQTFPKGHACLGQSDIYVWSGQKNDAQSIVDGVMREWFFNLISPDNFRNCFTMKHVPEKEIWFCVPEAGAQYATLALTWNWVSGAIGFRDLPGVPFGISGVISSPDATGDSWGE